VLPYLCLQDYPEFRQAENLKSEVDERVVKDGLLGLGLQEAGAAGSGWHCPGCKPQALGCTGTGCSCM